MGCLDESVRAITTSRVNLILFEPQDLGQPLPRTDRRAIHLLDVLRRQAGDNFDAGLVNGPHGKGTLVAVGPDALTLSFNWGEPASAPLPLTLIVGLPRPQTARDLLREMTALGVTSLQFVATEKTEPGYATSTLWSSGEWRRQVIAGAEQAFDPRLPEIRWGHPLAEALADVPADAARVALDNYEATAPLEPGFAGPEQGVALAIGPERGWTKKDREQLRAARFPLLHLGPRVLRVETAAIAAIALIRAQRRWR